MTGERHTVNIGDETWKKLQDYAEGFDSPEDVIRKLLGLEPSARKKARDPYVKDLWELKTDADILEMAQTISEEAEALMEGYQDGICGRVDELFLTHEWLSDDPAEEDESWKRYEALTLLGERAVLELVAENINSNEKMPEGGEDDSREKEARTQSGRPSHPSNRLRSV